MNTRNHQSQGVRATIILVLPAARLREPHEDGPPELAVEAGRAR